MEKTPAQTNGNTKIKVVMFPFLAHGHIIPYLALAKKLASRNFSVFLCSTPANLAFVRGKLDEEYSLSIQLVELHLKSSKDFPPHLHTTNGLPQNLMPTLKNALDNARPEFKTILENLKPDVLIHDYIQPWAGEAARKLGIPGITFISSNSTMASIMYHAFAKRGTNDFPFWSNVMRYREYEQDNLRGLEEAAKRRGKEDMAGVESIDQSDDIVLINGFKEIEGKYLQYLSELSTKKIVSVGPLVQENVLLEGSEEQSSRMMEWLNQKKQGSTVFVSFGSEYFLSKEDIEEIAHGLELSGVNFVWVLRAPKGEVMNLDAALPDGFLKRVGDRGLVLDCWAPQKAILQHGSIGGFVSHCGWNSVLEAMTFGVPMIAIPMHLDQPINARLVEGLGVGLEAVKDGNGVIQRNAMAAAIVEVVVDEYAKKRFRKKAMDIRDIIRSKGDKEVDDIASELINISMKKIGQSF